MTEHERLEEQLRIVRGLAQRVGIFRALFAVVALLGGIASFAVAVWMLHRTGFLGSADAEEAMTAREFIRAWLLPLVVAVATGLFLIWREARVAGSGLHSLGVRLAFRSVLPMLLVGAAVTYVAWRNPSDLDGPIIVALTWNSCYGVALLALVNFAPRALGVLGWAFIITAVIWLLIISAPTLPDIDILHAQTGANLLMGLSFGLYHLLYALGTWITRGALSQRDLR